MVHLCTLCSTFAAKSLKVLIRHLGLVHAHQSGFYLRCQVPNCPRTYNKFLSYKKHMYSKHQDVLGSSTSSIDQFVDSHNSDEDHDSVEETPGTESSQSNPNVFTRREAMLFVLKAKHVHHIAQSSLCDLIGDFTSLLDRSVHCLHSRVCDVLGDIDPILQNQIDKVFEQQEIIDPFYGLTSEYMQNDFFKDTFNFVEPVERKLGYKICTVNRNSRPCIKRKWDYVYDVPLLSSLQQIISDPLILREILSGHQQDHDLLGDYCDGSVYQSHPLFSTDPTSLQIILYYDDVEVCNPLGSRAKKHKLALFYYTLGNIHPKYRSTMKCIQLLNVVKSTVLQKYGVETILGPFMEDLKALEQDGVSVNIDGQKYVFKGTVSLVPSDNLASHYLGGYKSLSSALRKCRHCMAVTGDMSTAFVSESFTKRTKETHAAHCASLNGPLRDHFAVTYGIVRDSILNQSKYFHVTEGLIPDVMHDVLEGSLPYEVKEMLNYFIRQKLISRTELNAAMESFPYLLSDARNRPAPIAATTLSSSDHNLKQNATQMWCLGRLLPLMIGEKIPETDEHWSNFLCHLDIVDYLLAPILSMDCTSHLKELIREHHEGFRELYPLCTITPKMHYMVHYPECIQRFGPLVRSWCMRFEGKHSYFKDVAHRVKCFKNIPKTMAYRHQEQLCYHLSSNMLSGSSFVKEIMVGPAFTCEASELPYKDEILELFPSYEDSSKITRLKWVEVNGTKYSKGSVVILSNDSLPSFGEVTDIFVVSEDYYLVCTLLCTHCFRAHFHAYEVSKTSDHQYVICTVSELKDHSVYCLYTLDTQPNHFISIKYHIVEDMYYN